MLILWTVVALHRYFTLSVNNPYKLFLYLFFRWAPIIHRYTTYCSLSWLLPFFSHSLSQERLSIFPRVHLLFFFSSFFFAQCVDKYSRYIYNSSSNVLKPAISNSMPSVRLNTFSKWCSLYKCIHSISDQRKQHYLFSLHTYFLQLDFISFSPSTKNHFMC